ncbi:MAG: nuclear transport factor 2 family protein [Gemmatimonadetes bacterium]|nr:nuclear transport factor 2 family protein [Gemmatimonadota bacterium]MYG34818.1 nuclear transport factor 2 family protein [Gemmatimonadota bacterium]
MIPCGPPRQIPTPRSTMMIRASTTVAFVALFLTACTPAVDDQTEAARDAGAAGSESGTAGSPMGQVSHMPTDAEREAILSAVQGIFDALAAGDGDILREIMHPDVLMHSVERTADGTRSSSTSTRDQLIARLEGSGEVLTERMWDAEVRVSGDLAMVWTPYDFYVGDDLSHCGADALLLTRNQDESWTIIALSWTRLQPPVCELHPDGPPA